MVLLKPQCKIDITAFCTSNCDSDLYKNVIEMSKLLMALEVATSRLEKNRKYVFDVYGLFCKMLSHLSYYFLFGSLLYSNNPCQFQENSTFLCQLGYGFLFSKLVNLSYTELDLDSRLGEIERVLAEKYGHRQDTPHMGVSEKPNQHQPGATPTASHQQDDSSQENQVGTGEDEKEPDLTGSYDHQQGHEGDVKTEELLIVTDATGEGDMNTEPPVSDHGRVTLRDPAVDQEQQQQMGIDNELNELDHIIDDMARRLASHHDTKPLAELRSNARSANTWGEARRRTNISPEIEALDRTGRLIEREGMPWMPRL